MSFKGALRLRRAAGPFAFLLLWGCLGCGDHAPVTESQAKFGTGAGCLSEYDTTIRDYFNGRASDDQVSGLFDCASHALTLFVERVRGQTEGVYLPEELRMFLHRYFLTEMKNGQLVTKRITDGMLKQSMILKQVLLGGSAGQLLSSEILTTIELLKTLKAEALRLRPYMPISSDHFNDLRGDELERGLRSIAESGEQISKLFVRGNQPYQLSDLSDLLFELEQLIEKGEEGRGPRVLRDNIEVFFAAKQIVFGGPDTSILPQEWTRLFSTGADWYSLYLQAQNLNARRYVDWRTSTGQGESWYYGKALTDFVGLVNDLRKRAQTTLSLHPGKVVEFAELHHLIDTLTEPPRKDWNEFNRVEAYRPFDAEMSSYLKFSTIPLIRHVLGGYKTDSEGRDASGVTPSLIERVWSEFSVWFGQQKYLEKAFMQEGGEAAFNNEGLTRDQILNVPEYKLQLFSLAPQILPPEQMQSVVFDMRELIKRFRPFFPGNSDKVYFPNDSADPKVPRDPKGLLYSYQNLSRMNWMRSGARVLIRGYATDRANERARSYGGVTEDELDHFYWDFRSMGIKVGFLDPTSFTAARRRFKEANLFTSVADGGKLLSLDEGIELFSFLLSAGGISGTIHEEISKVCPVGTKDQWGRYEIDISCFRKEFIRRFQTDWDGMPGMVQYFEGLTPDEQVHFMKNLEDAGRKGGYADGQMIVKFETDVLVMILHYIESVFTRHDTNHSGTIDAREAVGDWMCTDYLKDPQKNRPEWKYYKHPCDDPDRDRGAFPIFRDCLLEHPAVKAAGLTKDSDLEAIFTYMLKNGHPPETTWEKISFSTIWEHDRSSWSEIHADRGLVLQIFSNLALN